MIVEEKYLKYYKKYPYAIMIFDLYLYYKSLGHDSRVLKKQKDRLNLIIKNGLSSKIIFKKMIRSLMNQIQNYNNKSVLILGLQNKYIPFVNGLISSCKKNNLGVYFNSNFKNSNKYKILNFDLLLSISKNKSILSYCKNYSVDDILDNHELMTLLDWSIFQEICYYKNLIKSKNISAIFSRTDQASRNQILCYASKKIKTPFIVVPHGHGLKVSKSNETCNDKADYYLLWSEQAKKHYILKGTKESKLINFGYPKYDRTYLRASKFYSTTSQTNRITFLETPFKRDHTVDGIRFIDTIYEKLVELQSHGFEIAIRPHPHQRNDQSLIKFCEKKNFYFQTGDILKDFLSSKYCLATITSSLFEASVISGNAIQLVLPYDYIPVTNAYQVEVEKLIDFITGREREEIEGTGCDNQIKQNQNLLIDDFSAKFDQYLPEWTKKGRS